MSAPTRTAKGTAQDKTAGASITLSSVAIADGASVVVCIAYDATAETISSVTWNGQSLTIDEDVQSLNGGAGIASLHGVTGATGDVVVTFTGSVTGKAIAVSEWTEIQALDVDVSATGSSTTPSSGATANTAYGNQVAIGCVATVGPDGDTAGSWSNSFSAGQRLGTTGGADASNVTVSEGYLAPSHADPGTGITRTAAKTGITSREWQAICAVYPRKISRLDQPDTEATWTPSGGIDSTTRGTAANMKDGSDATYTRGSEASATAESLRQEWDMPAVGAWTSIDEIVIRARILGDSGPFATHTPSLAGTTRGTGVVTSTIGWREWRFATDPADAGAWTEAKLDAQAMGIMLDLAGDGLSTAQGDVYEFQRLIYGVPADVAVTPAAVDASADGVTVTGVPGLRTVVLDPVEAQANVSQPASLGPVAGSYNPQQTTPKPAYPDSTNVPTVLRIKDANLSDQNLATIVGMAVAGPATGTKEFTTAGLLNDPSLIEGSGLIDHLVVWIISRVREGDSISTHVPGSSSNYRINIGDDWALTSKPPSGGYGGAAPLADHEIRSTVDITTKAGGGAWTWDDIRMQFQVGKMKIRYDYNVAVGDFVDYDVAEVWIEVHGPQGVYDEPIVVAQPIGDVTKPQRIVDEITE